MLGTLKKLFVPIPRKAGKKFLSSGTCLATALTSIGLAGKICMQSIKSRGKTQMMSLGKRKRAFSRKTAKRKLLSNKGRSTARISL